MNIQQEQTAQDKIIAKFEKNFTKNLTEMIDEQAKLDTLESNFEHNITKVAKAKPPGESPESFWGRVGKTALRSAIGTVGAFGDALDPIGSGAKRYYGVPNDFTKAQEALKPGDTGSGWKNVAADILGTTPEFIFGGGIAKQLLKKGAQKGSEVVVKSAMKRIAEETMRRGGEGAVLSMVLDIAENEKIDIKQAAEFAVADIVLTPIGRKILKEAKNVNQLRKMTTKFDNILPQPQKFTRQKDKVAPFKFPKEVKPQQATDRITSPKWEGSSPPLKIEDDIVKGNLPQLISAANESMALVRKELDLGRLASKETHDMQKSLIKAIDEKVPENARLIAGQIIQGTKAQLEVYEQHGLVLAVARRKNEFNEISKRLAKEKDPTMLKEMNGALTVIEAEVDEITLALRESSRQWGLLGRAKQMGITPEYDMLSVVGRHQGASGKEIKKGSELWNKFQKLTEQVAEGNKTIEKLQRKMAESTAGRELKSHTNKYKKMSVKEKDVELGTLITKATELLKVGC